MSDLHYIFTNEQTANEKQDHVSTLNLGLPKDGTIKWAIVQKAVNENLWFFKKPLPEGYINSAGEHFTQAQMIAGLEDCQEMERQDFWFPEPTELV